MTIQDYLITYEVFDKGFTIFRYYDETGLVLFKKEYLFYTIKEARILFTEELQQQFKTN